MQQIEYTFADEAGKDFKLIVDNVNPDLDGAPDIVAAAAAIMAANVFKSTLTALKKATVIETLKTVINFGG
jgi:hypothetical protein